MMMVIADSTSTFTKVIPCPNERKYSSAVLKMAMGNGIGHYYLVLILFGICVSRASIGFIRSKVI